MHHIKGTVQPKIKKNITYGNDAEMKGCLHHYPVPTSGIILHNLHSHLFGLMDTCNTTAGKICIYKHKS